MGGISLITLAVLGLASSAWAKEQLTDDQVRSSKRAWRNITPQVTPAPVPTITLAMGRVVQAEAPTADQAGRHPLCYPTDVTAGMVQDWRAHH